MNDGNLLLKAVLRTKAREDAAVAGLVDYVLDHIPGVGETLRLDVLFRTRGGVIAAWWQPRSWRNGIPTEERVLRVDFHRRLGSRGTRSRTAHIEPQTARAVAELRYLIEVTFRS